MSDFDCVTLQLAGQQVDCRLRFTDTRNFLRRYIAEAPALSVHPVSVSEQAFLDWEKAGNAVDAFAEFCLLCQPVSEALMAFDRCVFHASALRFRGGAVLLCGGSGAGKSTHSRMLLEKHPDEFSVINGDKPILEFRDESVIVHPSPWNGKEGYHGAPASPLRGLYFLRRASADSLEVCPQKLAVLFSFPMVFQSFSDEKVIRESARITELLLRNTSSYTFCSFDLEHSSDLLYHSIRDGETDDL